MARHAQQAMSLPQQLARRDPERLRDYAELLAFYQGEQWPAQTRRRERRLTFNYAKALIEIEHPSLYPSSRTSAGLRPPDEAGRALHSS